MRTGRPQTALEAVTWRPLPFSSWPWWSVGYLLVRLLVGLAAVTVMSIPADPWLELIRGHYQPGAIVGLILLGAALVAALGPVFAIPLTVLGRWRLGMVDKRPASPSVRRRSSAGGVAAWLRTRYTDPVAWRETGYACLLATLIPALSLAALFAVLLAVVFAVSPVIVMVAGSRTALIFAQVSTVRQSVPYMIVGIVALPLLPYLVTLVAGADAVLTRALLFGGPADQLRAELTEVSASRARLADAFEAERRRIERDLHDGAQQKLVALTMQLGLARMELPSGSPAAESVAAAHEQAKHLMAELRELIHGIQPQILTDLGLPAALGELADQAPIPVTVDAELGGRLPRQVENTAYFVAAEALTNIAKHSGATSATVTARRRDKVLTIEVTDNGHGGAAPGQGSGLTGLADRVAVTGGRMLLSSPPGGPTVLRVEVPCLQTSPSHG